MRKSLVKLSAAALLGVLALTACSSSKVIEQRFEDGADLAEAVLPVKTVDGEYAWNMMQMTSVTYKFTLKSDSYVVFVEDYGVTDKTSAMFFHRTWNYTGALSLADNVYTFEAAEHCTKFVEYGSSFAEYESVWGAQGTQKDDAKDLARFKKATATLADNKLTFTLSVE